MLNQKCKELLSVTYVGAEGNFRLNDTFRLSCNKSIKNSSFGNHYLKILKKPTKLDIVPGNALILSASGSPSRMIICLHGPQAGPAGGENGKVLADNFVQRGSTICSHVKTKHFLIK